MSYDDEEYSDTDGALIIPREGDIISPTERIKQLETELAACRQGQQPQASQQRLSQHQLQQRGQEPQWGLQGYIPTSAMTAAAMPTDPRQRVINILTNPGELRNRFELSNEQADNVAAIINGVIAGAGTGYMRKALTQHVGAEMAGAIGGLLSGLVGGVVSKKMIGR